MKLYLLRHAKTQPTSKTGRDFDRCLALKGHLQGEELKTFFLQITPNCDVWCSSAMRTRETLDFLLPNSSFKEITYSEDIYLCSAQTYLKKIWSKSDTNDLMIVGHNFGISDLAGYLSDEQITMKTGQLIVLKFEADSWMETSRGTGAIIANYRPEVPNL